jgi:hypothetical protein
MKTLFAGIILIVILGFGGFIYRNAMQEHRSANVGACTLEAKVCPDGTAVGRSGPDCSFAPCPYPNVSIDDAHISFAVPGGYTADENAYGADASLIAAFSASTSTPADSIVVRDYPIPEGKTSDEVILANTHLEPSDMSPSDMSKYAPKIVGTRTFSEITVERFEAVVHTAYFLPRAHDVLEFEVLEHDVKGWMDPSLIPDNLPAHQALIKMLGTLEDTSPAS